MANEALQFEAHFSNVMIDDASQTFVRRLFSKYAWLLVAVCVVNIIGFVLVLILPGTSTPMIVAIGVLAAIGPMYFPWQYFRLPKALAAPLKRGPLKPSAIISISPSSFTISVKGQEFTRGWADLKAVVEYPEYFLLEVTFLAFAFIPKKDMSSEAQQLVREALQLSVQPNPLMQPTGQQRSAAD